MAQLAITKQMSKQVFAAQLVIIKQMSGRYGAAQLAIIKQMRRQVSHGSAVDYQADEQAGVARLSWRLSGR